ncbi:hypothetical protein ACCS91_39335, partial [Rhizobium ruizarguesonis]
EGDEEIRPAPDGIGCRRAKLCPLLEWDAERPATYAVDEMWDAVGQKCRGDEMGDIGDPGKRLLRCGTSGVNGECGREFHAGK